MFVTRRNKVQRGLASSSGPEKEDRMAEIHEAPELLTPAEVAALFRVNPKTVTRWARAGRISYIKTLGGHRRFRADEIQKLLADANQPGPES